MFSKSNFKIIYVEDISKEENNLYLDDITQIMRQVFGEENQKIGIKCSYNLLSEIYTTNSKGVILAIKENNVIGFLSYRYLVEFTAYINWFAVKKEFRNNGVGGALLSSLEELVKKENISNILLISQDNSYYERFNYEKIKKTYRDKIVKDINRDEWLMIKSLY